jgi:hypothetical protein
MSVSHRWIVACAVITATMFRAHYYGYDQGLWSWIIVVTFVIPLVFGLWRMLVAATAVYVMFHLAFYIYPTVPYVKLFAQYFMLAWLGIFVAWMWGRYRVNRFALRGKKWV